MDITQFNFIQYTEAELKELTKWQKYFAWITKKQLDLAEQMQTAEGDAEAELKAQMQETTAQRNTATVAIMNINQAAEDRYYTRANTEQLILDDARKVLAAATKEDYEAHEQELHTGITALAEYIEQNKNRLTKAELEAYQKAYNDSCKPPELNYSGYFAYLLGCTRFQFNAFRHNDLSAAPLADLIREQAAGAYEPPEEKSEALTEQQIVELATVAQAPLDNAELAIDKVNTGFIKLLKNATEGQLAFFGVDTIMAERSNPEPLVTVSVDFTGLEENIARSISYYDKRVMAAINTLWENGETKTTLYRVYMAMGGKGNAAATDLEKIKNSLKKQAKILIEISNELEVEKGYNYTKVSGFTNLLLVKAIAIEKNGKIVESGVQIFDKPILIDFAKRRNQITTIPLKMLQAPINKTERNLAIEDYIQVRICREEHQAKEAAISKYKEYTRAKSSKAFKNISITKKMLYSTIFDNAEISGRMAQHRAKETIQKILDYYKGENIKNITACKYEADAVTITYTYTPEQIAQAIAIQKEQRRKKRA